MWLLWIGQQDLSLHPSQIIIPAFLRAISVYLSLAAFILLLISNFVNLSPSEVLKVFFALTNDIGLWHFRMPDLSFVDLIFCSCSNLHFTEQKTSRLLRFLKPPLQTLHL
jgi:hypothetical protein